MCTCISSKNLSYTVTSFLRRSGFSSSLIGRVAISRKERAICVMAAKGNREKDDSNSRMKLGRGVGSVTMIS